MIKPMFGVRTKKKVVIQVSGFDDKVNILGLVTGSNNLSPFGRVGGGGAKRDGGPT